MGQSHLMVNHSPGRSVLQPAGPRRRVIFWRHGRTSWNAAGRFQGQSDIPLDDVGASQASRAAALLAGKLGSASNADHAVRIISSDLSRAYSTAQELASLIGTPVAADPRLRETFGGEWEGKTFEEIISSYPEQIKLWQRDEPGVRAGGERPALKWPSGWWTRFWTVWRNCLTAALWSWPRMAGLPGWLWLRSWVCPSRCGALCPVSPTAIGQWLKPQILRLMGRVWGVGGCLNTMSERFRSPMKHPKI